MLDLKVTVSAPGATQSANEVRRFGGAVADASNAQKIASETAKAHTSILRQFAPAIRQAILEYDKLEKAAEKAAAATKKATAEHGKAGGHGGLAALFPRGYEAMGGRIASAVGLGGVGGPALAGAAAALPALYMYMEFLSERTRVLTEHEKELTVARLDGVRAAINARDEQNKQGTRSADRNAAAFTSLAATGGEEAVSRGKQLEMSGAPGAVEAAAEAYRKFSRSDQRDRAIKIAQEGSRLGMGNMDTLMSKISPFSFDGTSNDMQLRNLGAVDGIPLSQSQLEERRRNSAASPTAAMLRQLQLVKGRASAVETSRIGGAITESRANLSAVSTPEGQMISEARNKYQTERASIMAEQDVYEQESRGSFFGGLSADISHAVSIYRGTSPLQRVAQLEKKFSAETDPLLAQISASAAQAAAALSQMNAAINSRTSRSGSPATP